jgi:hypothetical protein
MARRVGTTASLICLGFSTKCFTPSVP